MSAKQTTLHAVPRLANFFGLLGYISIAMQWLWALLMVGYPLLMTLISFSNQQTEAHTLPTFEFTFPSEVSFVIVIIVTIVMTLVGIGATFFMPKTIGNETAHLTQATAARVIPVITQNRRLSKKKRNALSVRIMLATKVAFALTPFLLVYLLPGNHPLPYIVATTLAWICLGCTIIWFAFQYMTAFLQKRDFSQLR